MDYDAHYRQVDTDQANERERERERFLATQTTEYNSVLVELKEDVARLLGIYRQKPPKEHAWIELDGVQRAVWEIGNSGDYEEAAKLFLLPNGQVAIFKAPVEHKQQMGKRLDQSTGIISDAVVSDYCQTGSYTFAGCLRFAPISGIEQKQVNTRVLQTARLRIDEALNKPRRLAEAEAAMAQERARRERLEQQEREKHERLASAERKERIVNTRVTRTFHVPRRIVNGIANLIVHIPLAIGLIPILVIAETIIAFAVMALLGMFGYGAWVPPFSFYQYVTWSTGGILVGTLLLAFYLSFKAKNRKELAFGHMYGG